MKNLLTLATAVILVAAFLSCERIEKVTETEYVHDIKYIENPPDTIFKLDTLYRADTVIIRDTVEGGGIDTVIITNIIRDTVRIHDTVTITNIIHDTITVTRTIHDTVTVIDTVETESCPPYAHFAFVALQYHADAEVIAFINSEFGYEDGWVYYLSIMMSEMSNPSTGVYDFYGYIDYWAPDWSGYYPIEYYFRVSYLGGDVSDPDNWQLSEPPSNAKNQPGLHLVTRTAAGENKD